MGVPAAGAPPASEVGLGGVATTGQGEGSGGEGMPDGRPTPRVISAGVPGSDRR